MPEGVVGETIANLDTVFGKGGVYVVEVEEQERSRWVFEVVAFAVVEVEAPLMDDHVYPLDEAPQEYSINELLLIENFWLYIFAEEVAIGVGHLWKLVVEIINDS